MKRAFSVLLALCLCFLLAMSAFADVIYEPEDSFYEKHREECYYENRVYIAAGENGYAAVKKDPTSKKTETELPNGTEVYISYVWDQDGGWGLKDSHGWISMSELTVKYDSISFEQEYGSEFIYLEEWEFIDLTGRDYLNLWRYPGDAEPFATLGWQGEGAWFSEPPEDLSFNTIYEDPEGRRWGYVNYFYGLKDFWVCLTDPDDASIGGGGPAQKPVEAAPTEAPAPSEAPAPTEAPTPTGAPASPEPTYMPPIIDPEPPQPTLWGPALLAVGAMAAAGGLLALLRKRK